MPTVQTVLTEHSTRDGRSARGPWRLHIFKAANGDEYTTLDQGAANQAYALLNQPANVDYEERPAKDPKYPPNRNLMAATPSDVHPNIANPTYAPQAAPAAPAPSTDERQLAIMRQSGLERAIRTAAAGIVKVAKVDELFALSDTFVSYFQHGQQASQPETDEAAPQTDVGF